MYKIQETEYLGIYSKSIIRLSDMANIPYDEANNDYQEYLKWVNEGNIAEEWNSEEGI
jgi:hypothetical protein